jgi:predicted RNA-binding protein with RPS1 domain
MPPLNSGRYVEDATSVVNVGQSVYVRVTGKNDKGQLNLALAREDRA